MVEGYSVHLRVWDVDDPFDQNHPSMHNVAVIDNDAAGPDNRLTSGTVDPAVVLGSETTNGSGVARMTVIMSIQPGNNYRGGASAMVDGVGDDIVTQADADANQPPPPVMFSEMLTVWRQVWLELDSMASGTDINYSGEMYWRTNNSPHPGDGSANLIVPDINDDGRFEGGTLTFPSSGRVYTLIDNTEKFIYDDYVTSTLININDIDRIGDIVDDDTAVLPKTPDANVTVLNDKYRNCYVSFTEDPATRDNNNIFDAMLRFSNVDVANKCFENDDYTPAADFWLCVIVTCYQSHHTAGWWPPNASNVDGDPDIRYHIHGTTWSTGDDTGLVYGATSSATENATTIYLEAILDDIAQIANGWKNIIPQPLSFMEPYTIAHELGHQFGLGERPPGLTLMSIPYDGVDRDLDGIDIAGIRGSTELSSH